MDSGPTLLLSEIEEFRLPMLIYPRGFTIWSRKMKVEIAARGLWDYVEEVEDGGIPDPRKEVREYDPNGTKEERDQYDKWISEKHTYCVNDAKVLRLLGHLPSSEFHHIVYLGLNARDTFQRLKFYFEPKSL